MWRDIPLTMLLPALALGLAGCTGPSPKGDRITYMAVGASDAVGAGAEPLTNGYVYRIGDALEAQVDELAMLNLGISGAQIDAIAELVSQTLRAGRQASLVTVWVGANDLIAGRDTADFEARLRRLLKDLREHAGAAIVVGNLPDVSRLPRFVNAPSPTVTMHRIAAYNAAIERQADAAEASVVDLFSEPVTRELVSDCDGFHPSNAGHRRIAEAFLRAIWPALGLSASGGIPPPRRT